MSMYRPIWPALSLAIAACGTACGGGSSSSNTDLSNGAYVVSSIVSTSDESFSYVSVIGSLDAQTLDYGKAYEFPGISSDLWVWNGKVYIADGDAPVVHRYAVDDTGALVEESALSFASYGAPDAAFWNAIWISPSKAYLANGQGEYVIWDPSATPMRITGTMPHPDLADRGIQKLRPASTDRGVIVQGNRLYHPYHWVDASYTSYSEDSRVAIYDTDTDTLIATLEAPCTGLDIATQDEAGNLYFSNWTGNVGLSLVHKGATPCAIKLPAGATAIDPEWTLPWPQITDGRGGAALRFSDDGHALLSVFHGERTQFDDTTDPFALVGSANWRLWRMDLTARTAAPVDGIDWNSGATYMSRIDNTSYVMVPASNYASTTIYAVTGDTAQARFQTRGWSIRLFRVR